MSIKVTDRRMFTEDGELREGFEAEDGDRTDEPSQSRADEGVVDPSPAARPNATAPPPASRASDPAPTPPAAARGEHQDAATARPEVDTGEPLHEAAQFLEIVGSLVEPATLFLGDAQMPDGRNMEDLDRARIYIDLLQVLQEKTSGNLTAEEDSVLSEILYRLRMRYVQKRNAR